MILLVGNWKMAPEKTLQALSLAKATAAIAAKQKKKITTVVCPGYVHLTAVAKLRSASIVLGAQHVSTTTAVAATGQVSAAQLRDSGAQYCIVGHSEVRALGETNEMTRESVLRLLEKKITPILCVGERERDMQGFYLSEVKDQIDTVLAVIPKAALKRLVIAYEPVWAIGAEATREATPLECREMSIFIRKVISDRFDTKAAAMVTILYGGSVHEGNARTFINEGDVQGLLVGRVSLDPKRFGTLAKSLI